MAMEKRTNSRPAKTETHRPPVIVGLTGGVASGKSTVAKMFGELGAEVIDADAIAHKVLQSPGVCEKLRERWGEQPFDKEGRPDRTRIADIVFDAPEKLEMLNRWVHPATREKMRARLESARNDPNIAMIVIDAPLLMEAGLDRWCDVLVFIETEQGRRRERARAARQWTREEIARRESLQQTLDEKRKRADYVISNNRSPEEAQSEVAGLFRRLTRSSDSRKKPQTRLMQP